MSVNRNLSPYLGFRDSARAALEFYAGLFSGELELTTFGEFGMGEDKAERALIMHGQLTVDGEALLMASDTPKEMELPPASSTRLALFGGPEDEARLRGYWAALSEGGTIEMPLELAPWGDAFGQLTDRFGTPWFVNIAGEQPQG